MNNSDLIRCIEALAKIRVELQPFIRKMYDPAYTLNQYDKVVLREYLITMNAYIELMKQEQDHLITKKRFADMIRRR